MRYPSSLLTLIAMLRKLPGVGSKTAERYAFQLLSWPEKQIKDFSLQLSEIKQKIIECSDCGCLTEEKTCYYCNAKERNQKLLCVISSPKDAFLIEESQTYLGLYHVIKGLLSPIEGTSPEELGIPFLKERIQRLGIEEVIIALDATIEGDATALYLKKELEQIGVRTTRLAFGIPIGSSLDFVDGGTLARALLGRQSF